MDNRRLLLRRTNLSLIHMWIRVLKSGFFQLLLQLIVNLRKLIEIFAQMQHNGGVCLVIRAFVINFLLSQLFLTYGYPWHVPIPIPLCSNLTTLQRHSLPAADNKDFLLSITFRLESIFAVEQRD